MIEMLGYADEVRQARSGRSPATTSRRRWSRPRSTATGSPTREFNWFFLLLVNAGGDTTRNLVAAGVQLLFDHPDERARLQADLDGLLPTAVDEMLRYTSPVAHFRRTAMDDTVIRDQPIAAGDKVVVFYGSGNRDDDVFADPDRFDVGRDPEPAHGVRRAAAPTCASACTSPASRSPSLLRELLTRCPDLAPAGEPERMASSFIAGVRHMPVTFTPARP